MAFLWVRGEIHPQERRTCLLPEQAQILVNKGHTLKVERSKLRIIPDLAYEEAGCELVPSESWVHAEEKYYVLGIKELSKTVPALRHKHIYFAHCYKGQSDGRELLSRFKKGGGTLLDLEYLAKSNEKALTIGPAGYLSGYIGAAMGIQLYAQKKLSQPLKLSKPYFSDKRQLLDHTMGVVSKVKKTPSVVVIGYKGNSGRGAVDFLKELTIAPTLWGREETSCPGTLATISQFEVIVHCIHSDNPGAPFLVESDLYKEKKLSILVDVTCDIGGISHRFPFYSKTTTFSNPCLKVGPAKDPVHVIGIDRLTNWLPLEANYALAAPLFPFLENLLDAEDRGLPPLWEITKNKFLEHIRGL